MLPSPLRKRLIEDVLTLTTALDQIGSAPDRSEARWLHSWGQSVLARPVDEIKAQAIADQLHRPYAQQASRIEIVHELKEFIRSHVQVWKRADLTEQGVDAWLTRMDHRFAHTEVIGCVIPIEGLQIVMRPLTLGPVRFISRLQLLQELHDRSWPDVSHLSHAQMASKIEGSQAHTFAVYIGTGTYLRVEGDGIRAVQRAMELFWYAAPLLRPGVPLRFGLFGHVASRSVRSPTFHTWGVSHRQALLENGGNGAEIPALHPLDLALMDDDVRILERLHVFERAAYPQAHKDSLLAVLHEAVYWLATAAQQLQPRHRVISLATCLEALYGSTSQAGVTQLVSERCALSLAETVDDRLALQAKLKKLYGLRSRSVHGQGGVIDENDVNELQRLAYQAISVFITRMNWFANRDDYMAHFERWKMGEAPRPAGA